jgi:hypothetical protein
MYSVNQFDSLFKWEFLLLFAKFILNSNRLTLFYGNIAHKRSGTEKHAG